MRFLHLLRIVTCLVALAYGCASLPITWIYWLEEHFSSASAIYETGVSLFTTAGELGVYVTAPAAVLIVLIAVPRFSWGVAALSWCLLLMSVCLLTGLYRCYWDRYLSPVVQIVCYAGELTFALSPLILGLLLRYRLVIQQLRTSQSSEVTDAQSCEAQSPMRFLVFIRLVTAAIAVTYGSESLQHGWLYWLAAHLGVAHPSFGTGYNSSISVQQIGTYITAVAALSLVLFAIPRFRWGIPALSYCLLIMGVFLLSNLYGCIWVGQNLTFVMEITCFGRQIAFASPPLIVGLILRYRFAKDELRLTEGTKGVSRLYPAAE